MIAGVGDYNDHPKYLRECLNTLDSQGHLVSEILDIVKLSDNETELTQENFDLAELGNAVLNDYRQLAENKGIEIKGEFPRITLNTDRQLFKKVLSNLTANAVQNTQKGGEIRFFIEKDKKPLLCILNTCAHIPEDILTRLFEPFFRQDTARTRSGQTGLGLAIVKKALDRMRIKFSLENTDEGDPSAKLPAVLFKLELPL
jgi:two-component system sensor histidine kinase VanS